MARTRSGRNTGPRGRRVGGRLGGPNGRGGRAVRVPAPRGRRGGQGGADDVPPLGPPAPANNQDVNLNEPQDAAQGPGQGEGAPDPFNEMWERLGVDAEGIRYLRDPRLGGFTSLGVLANLPYDGMDDVFKNLERGGGYLPGGQNLNRGMRLPPPVKSNIQNLVFYCHYSKRAQRPLVPWEITPSFLRHFHTIKRDLTTRDDPPAPVINDRDWPKTFEALEEYLNGCKGSDIATLGYTIRPTEAPVDYPGEISDLDYHGGFSSGMDELINRCPIVDERGRRLAQFNMDNRRVWEKLVGICRDHACFTYAKVGQRTFDGRAAFHAMRHHYLGEHCHQTMAASAEKALNALTYSGETKRWSFEKFVTKQQEQFLIMEELRRAGTYRGIDEGSKVWKLLEGIKTNDHIMTSVKAQIISSPAHMQSYDKCVGLFKTAISMQKVQPGVASINAVGTVGNNRASSPSKDKDIPCDMSVELRYYTKKEYDKLNAAQRQGLYRKQQAARAKKQAAKIKKVQFNLDSDSDSDSDVEMEDASQRNSQIKKLQGKTQPGSARKSKKNAKHKRKGKGQH